MSTVSEYPQVDPNGDLRRSAFWLSAMLIPCVIAPVWLVSSSALPVPLQGCSRLLLVLLISVSAFTDISWRKIYNWATYSALLWAVAISTLPQSLAGASAIGFKDSLVGAAVCFLVMLVPYSLARGGAGDVKLAAAIGALIGVDAGLLVIAFAYIVAAVAILSWSIWQRGPVDLLLAVLRRLASKRLPTLIDPPSDQQKLLLDQPVPLAGFFLVSTLLVVFDVPVLLRIF